MKTLPRRTELKDIVKTALVEVLQEHRELLRDAMTDAVEEVALARAIAKGSRTKTVSRDEVFKILGAKGVTVGFNASFAKDLKNIGDGNLLRRIRKAIEEVEAASGPHDVANLKKLRGGRDYYRIRIGDWRIGLALEGGVMMFVRCLHRKEIYRYFP